MRLFDERQNIHYCYVGIFAFISGYVAIWLSGYFEIHQGLVNFYFPHALRVATLFVLPFRMWAVFLFCSIIGSDAYYHVNIANDAGISIDTVKTFLFYYSMELSTGAIIYAFYRKLVDDWFTVRGVFWITFLSMVYRLVYLAGPAYFKSGFFSFIPVDRYVEFLVAIQISGYIVGFYALLILFVIKWCTENKYRITQKATIRLQGTIGVIFFTCAVLVYISPELEYLIRIAIIIPFFLIASRFGPIAALSYSLLLVTALFIYLANATSELLQIYLPFILSYLLLGFFTFAVLQEHRRMTYGMLKAKKTLEDKNKNLEQMTSQLTKLSEQILSVQEQERQYLSRELHDEIGQNIIVLKSSVYMLEKHDNQDKHIDKIKEQLNLTYSSIYELMHWLRPSVLDNFGLIETLKGDYFAQKLELSDISYKPKVNMTVELNSFMQTAIFRICQEAVNNAIKHSSGNKFEIELIQTNEILHLNIKDNGNGQEDSIGTSGGFGLKIINERVTTLGGICIITNTDGFAISIRIPLTTSGDLKDGL